MDSSPPENFKTVVIDFVKDLSSTFPEFAHLWSKWSDPATSTTEYDRLFQYVLTVYPERFFDILYQNLDIFNEDSVVNTQFLPNVEFKQLFLCQGITEKTRASIWKYLQVILFTVVGSLKDKTNFGDSANLFDGIDESELQDKLKDTMGSISEFFSKMEENGTETKTATEPEDEIPPPFFGKGSMPNPEDIHDHLKNIFNGKIGKLAKELAEEVSGDFMDVFGEDMNNMKSTKDVFAKLMQNPQKISGLVKTVGEKLNQKMASGEISKDEIMGEAGELMRKMKEMGGAGNFADMFKNMAKGMGVNIPKNAKIDKSALMQMEKKMTANEKMKTRILAKKQKQLEEEMLKQVAAQKFLEERRKALADSFTIVEKDSENLVFRLNGQEKQEKSSFRNEEALIDAIVNEIEKPVAKLSASQKKKQKKKEKQG